MTDVCILKFDVDGLLDRAFHRIMERTEASSRREALQLIVAMVDFITREYVNGNKILVQSPDGITKEISIK